MPNTNSICSLINSYLQAGNFSTSKFQGAKYFNTAHPVETIDNEITKKRPVEIDNNGEFNEVVFSDNLADQTVLDISYSCEKL